MKDLRAAAAQQEGFEEAFGLSIKPTQKLLIKLFGRLEWKGERFEVSDLYYSCYILHIIVHLATPMYKKKPCFTELKLLGMLHLLI